MKNIVKFLKQNSVYALAAVLVVGLLVSAGVSGYFTNDSEMELAENAAEFTDVPEDVQKRPQTGMVVEEAKETQAPAETQMDIAAEVIKNQAEAINNQEVKGQENTEVSEQTEATYQEEANTESSENTELMENTEAELAQTVNSPAYDGITALAWPVEGTVILDYSMDTTTYFPTLDQYKCNPSLMIQAEVNTEVKAVGAGIVSDITTDAINGTVVTMDMGNGHTLSYGQMKDLTVEVGETVTTGEIIGTVSEPSRYYTIEGPHVSLTLEKDETPVDPKDYLE